MPGFLVTGTHGRGKSDLWYESTPRISTFTLDLRRTQDMSATRSFTVCNRLRFVRTENNSLILFVHVSMPFSTPKGTLF